jgi:hypothetical protein
MDENKTQPNKNNLKTVRTYMSDMADTVRENEISVIKVALAEQNKNAREDLYRKAEGSPVKKIIWIIGGVILMAGAIYGAYYFLKQKQIKEIPQQIIREKSIISYDETSSIDLTNENEFINKIKTEKSIPGTIKNKTGSIKFISLSKEIDGVKEKILIQDFFNGMKFTAPSSFIRSLSDSYMVGTYTKDSSEVASITDSTPKLFMIFKSKDYEFSYAGMLEWESTMPGDMLGLYELNTTDTKLALNKRLFKDVIISNKDSRVLYNENEKPILYYLFADKDTIIITDSIDAIKEISSRLVINNIKPL